MPIDDNPIKALQHQFEMEDLSSSPVTGKVIRIASELPIIPSPLAKVIAWLGKSMAANAAERDHLLMETIAQEVVSHDEELERTKKVLNE
jgi:hypothetical protein